MKQALIKYILTVCTCVTVFICLLISAGALTGDLDFNGSLKTADARLALRYSLKLENFDAKAFAKADVNTDGRVNSSDARLILRAVLKITSLDKFDNYYMNAKYTNSSTGKVTYLDTAWFKNEVLIRIDDVTTLIYNNSENTVTIVNHNKKQYKVMSFSDFKAQYPKNASYFADGAKNLRWSDNLPKPCYLIDEGYTKSTDGGNTVYRKKFNNGSQVYSFDKYGNPVKSEFYAGTSLITIEFISFSDNPEHMFSVYKMYEKV